MSGGGVVRAQGPGAARVRGTLDSTDIYAVLHAALFPLQQR
jgi:alkaline phosphatase